MLATVAFLAFWVVLGLALFFIAARGGPRGARATLQSQSRSGRRTAAVLFTAFYVLAGVAVPVAIAVANGEGESAKVGDTPIELTAQEARGREVFQDRCQSCHQLAGAGGGGKVGPSLDQLKPPKELVVDAVEQGRLRGAGTMPAGLTDGPETQSVAAFIAKVAGRG